MNCKICSCESTKIFAKKVLNKYEVNYYKCVNCLFIQTDEPFWLAESYKSAINYSDIGSANRSLVASENTTCLFSLLQLDRNEKYLDYGAGYGLYVRMMRDNGYNFYWQDDYCENIFASKFSSAELPIQSQKYKVVTSYEVFEHLIDPLKEIEKILLLTDSILFSTNLTNSCKGPIEDWWYISPMHGQHIAFYDTKTLEYIASKYNLNLYSSKNVHFLTKMKVNRLAYKIANFYRASRLYNTIVQPKSLKTSDFETYYKDSILDTI